MLAANMSFYTREFQATSAEAALMSLQLGSKLAVETFAFLFFFFGLTLNSIVIASFIYCWRQLDAIEALVINLAAGDILASLVLPLPVFVQLLEGTQHFGSGGCKLAAWLSVVSIAVTSLSLLLIAYCIYTRAKSRYLPGVQESIFWGCLFIIWVVPALEGLPYLATMDLKNGDCVPSWPQSSQTTFVVAMLILQIVCPLGLITRMGVVASLEIYRSRFNTEHPAEQGDNPSTFGDDTERYATKSILKMFLLMSGSFYIVLVPYTFFHLWLSLNIDNAASTKYIGQVYIAFHLLICSKVIFCPLIYFCTWDSVKQNVREMVCRFCRKRGQSFVGVKYTMSIRSNGHDSMKNNSDGEAMILTGEMPVIEEERGKGVSSTTEVRYSSSDYDLESDDTFREDVAIL